MMKTVGYPEWLEQWWIDRACRHYGVARLEDCVKQLEAGIRKLSDTFTVDRSETYGDYQRDPGLMLAYGLFFFPQNFARVQLPLSEVMARGWNRPAQGALRIVDLGSGTGAAGFGAALQLQSSGEISIHGLAIDQSEAALQVQQLIASRVQGQFWTANRADLRTVDSMEQADLIVASFSLNELGVDAHRAIDPLLERLNPRGMLLIVEPALKETSEQLESFRDRIAAEKRFWIWAPCLHSERCPLLRDGEFWCHEVRRWKAPESLVYLNRRLHRS
ncbi:MAG TPA: small ribosomal subunit Rsm22 family protein, partial [Acidobacteriota bacterium]|nr:small ribosomal subunit Rsm22 family protein [Acidobacteriota bacterium]